jgi:hypothetical protein
MKHFRLMKILKQGDKELKRYSALKDVNGQHVLFRAVDKCTR